jgi:hypothetical protein
MWDLHEMLIVALSQVRFLLPAVILAIICTPESPLLRCRHRMLLLTFHTL